MKIKGLGLERLMMLPFVIGCLLAALIITVAASDSHSASLEWRPEKNVELIVGTGPGTGTDVLARMIQMLWQTKDLVKTSVSVVNKPGGGTTIAGNYLNQHVGDGHYLMAVSSTFLTNYITGLSPLNYTDISPIAVLGVEPVCYWVRADSPIKTGKDLVNQLKKDPKSLSIGIAASRGNHNHIAIGLVMKQAGGDVKNLKIVVFDSSPKAMTALMGGHIDLVGTGIGGDVQNIQMGKLRVIAVASEKRLRGEVGNIPTWREQGIDAVVASTRTIVGPKGMSEAQKAYWDDVFAKLVQLNEWKKFDEESFSEAFYQNSMESKKFLEAQYGQFKAVLTDLGLAK